MDASKPSMTWNSENPSMIQPSSSPPPYQDSSFQGPSYSAQPLGYGFSQQNDSRFNQQPYGGAFQHPNQQPFRQTPQQPIQQPYSMAQQQPGQPGIFIVQPVVPNQQGSLLNDYMGYSIFTMLCCCLPLGIAALVNSIATRDANSCGDRQTAERSSRLALILNHTALGLGITAFVIAIVFVAVTFTLYN